MIARFARFALLLLVCVVANAQTPDTFLATNPLSIPRSFHSATLLFNGKVLIAGGWSTAANLPVWSSAELYDPSSGAFTKTGDMTSPRYGLTATLLPDGRVLVAGGSAVVNGNSTLDSAEIYDPSTGRFSAIATMTAARVWGRATLLTNGQVLITGGYTFVDGDPHALSSAELFDPVTSSFTATGNMNAGRSWHTATLLNNGKVLIDGGRGDETVAAELYDPATGVFSLTGASSLPNYLIPASSTLLATGNVLLTMQYSCDFADEAEVFDFATGSFVPISNMTSNRGYRTTTLLPDGKVLITGRADITLGGTAELYDPAVSTFSKTAGPFRASEEGHTATLLPDGTVLIAGGWICCGYTTNTAEIYHPAVIVLSPVLYSLPGGTQGAILHAATQEVVSTANPAIAGEALEIYGAGLVDGSAIPPQVSIGGRLAQVLFFGNAPGFAGLDQINVVVPTGITPNAAVPVRLTYLSRPSNAVTIGVQ